MAQAKPKPTTNQAALRSASPKSFELPLMFGAVYDLDPYLERLQREIARIDRQQVRRLSELIHGCWQAGQMVFVFGNGGSGATASHLCEDLNKNALRNAELADETARRPRVMSLTDNTSFITAIGNDLGFDQVFVQQLMHYGRPGDLAIAISGSGNSANVLLAVQWANRHGLVTFGLTGHKGGRLKRIAQEGLHIDVSDMGMVESLHLAIGHWLVGDLFARIHHVARDKESRPRGHALRQE
jgi:D-sedoheptulose 7-phosphate isomerase